jgi:AraC-like DNA-binding protein
MYTNPMQRPQDRSGLAFHGRSARAPQLSSPLPPADRHEGPLGRGHILVVEDDPQEQQTILRALRSAGHQVSLSADGSEGYRRATALCPDLILLKVRPRSPNGLATARLLNADPSTSQIPVIFLLRGATLEERLASLLQGAVDCVQVPVDGEALLMRLAVHLALARRVRRPGTDRADDDAAHPGHDAERVLVQAAKRLIEADLSTSRTLPHLATQVGTHAKRLSRAFRAHAGMTVFEFVRNARLLRARTLLRESALSVEEVGQAVGFSSAGNFSTAFRIRFGSTPSAYRSNHRVGGQSRLR